MPLPQRMQETELEYLFESQAAQTSMAENYVGLPLDAGRIPARAHVA